MKMSRWNQRLTARQLFVFTAALLFEGQSATGAVIFDETFAARTNGFQMVGTSPSPVNTGGAIFLRSPSLEGTSGTAIGEYAPGINGLLLNPQGGTAGSFDQNMWLPYNYTLGADKLRLRIAARQAQPRWNNFIMGFTNSTGSMSSWILLQTNSAVTQTSVQIFHANQQYSTTVAPAIYAGDFRTLVMDYDPTKVNTVGQNPFSLEVDNVNIPLNGSNVPALSSIGGVGFGFFFADGNFNRTVLLQSLRFRTVEQPTLHAGDFDGDGDVDGADFVSWQTNFPKSTGATLAQGDADSDGDVDGADFVVWQTNFPFTPSPGLASAVPEPSGMALALAAGAIAIVAARNPQSPRLDGILTNT
jgi:hypothetical protein